MRDMTTKAETRVPLASAPQMSWRLSVADGARGHGPARDCERRAGAPDLADRSSPPPGPRRGTSRVSDSTGQPRGMLFAYTLPRNPPSNDED